MSTSDGTEQLKKSLILLLTPNNDEEMEELFECIDIFGTDIFNNLDYVDLPTEHLEKLDAIYAVHTLLTLNKEEVE